MPGVVVWSGGLAVTRTGQDILLARSEHDREARLAMVAKLARSSGACEQYVNILRENGDKQLRGFHNAAAPSIRRPPAAASGPLNGREKKKEDTIAVEVVDPFTVSVTRDDHDAQADGWQGRGPLVSSPLCRKWEFAYDAIFGPNSTQAEVFAECKGMVPASGPGGWFGVQSMVDGYNVTVFTSASYGRMHQIRRKPLRGASERWMGRWRIARSHTRSFPEVRADRYGSGSEPGLSPRLCEEIFRVTHRDREKPGPREPRCPGLFDFAIRASMVELYLAARGSVQCNPSSYDLGPQDPKVIFQEPPKLDFKPYRQADGSIGQRLEGVTELAVANSEDLAKASERSFNVTFWAELRRLVDESQLRQIEGVAAVQVSVVETLPGRVCDGCHGTLAVDGRSFACAACGFDACGACMEAEPAEQAEIRTAGLRRKLERYQAQARCYADPRKQRRALQLLPPQLAAIATGAGAPGEEGARELLRWFQADFFRWTDSPWCETCDAKTTRNEGMIDPSEEELRYGAARVESWRCERCQGLRRFPRYSDPERLLESRHGRCGEWANCFTLICSALGFQARLVVDWTDHVWTELWVSHRWRHCDPCEAAWDAPLTYEAGWGKKLSYVIAFSPQEVVDVTPRYTGNWPDVLLRRTVPEDKLQEIIREVDEAARAPSWRQAELAELRARISATAPSSAALSAAELRGRGSGSAAWRAARGELGAKGGAWMPVKLEAGALLISSDTDGLPADSPQLQLLNGAVLSSGCLDLTAPSSAAELECSEAQLEGRCTVEVWVAADADELHCEDFRNPVVSSHGAGSGWELRLRKRGGARFLVTLDGRHQELEAEGDSWQQQWVHLAGSFDGSTMRVFVAGKLAAEHVVPPGAWSSWAGPLCLGRNPAWRDRKASCRVHSARLAPEALEPKDFLPPPAECS
ncbi:unnamed protein product [Effrenium voratum]|nr:unnamed protein product [Effrenium voratum]